MLILPSRIPVPILEVSVTPMGAQEVAEIVAEAARAHQGLTVGNLNLHGVYMHHTNPEFAQYCAEADLILVDGAPVALAAGLSTKLRVGSTDWLDAFMPFADGLRILAVGGTSDASSRAERHFRAAFPEVEWVGVDGFTSQEPDGALLAQIAAADIVLVGMGMGAQERWILRHRTLLEGKVVANVGGCFDYYAGTQKLAPRWMGRFGIEWLYRLAVAPKRLAYRYLVEPLKLIPVIVKVKRAQRIRR